MKMDLSKTQKRDKEWKENYKLIGNKIWVSKEAARQKHHNMIKMMSNLLRHANFLLSFVGRWDAETNIVQSWTKSDLKWDKFYNSQN
jgi:hypothetical protein